MEHIVIAGLVVVIVSFYCCGRSVFNFDLLPKNLFRPIVAQTKTWLKNLFRRKNFLKRKEKVRIVSVKGYFVTLSH